MPSPVVDLPWSLLRRISRGPGVPRSPSRRLLDRGRGVGAAAALAVDQRLDGVTEARAAWGDVPFGARRRARHRTGCEPRSPFGRITRAPRRRTGRQRPRRGGRWRSGAASDRPRRDVLGHHVAPGTVPPVGCRRECRGSIPASASGLPLALGDLVDVVASTIRSVPRRRRRVGARRQRPGHRSDGRRARRRGRRCDVTDAAAAASGRAVLVLRRTPAAPQG